MFVFTYYNNFKQHIKGCIFMDFQNIYAKDDLGNIYQGTSTALADRIRLTIPKPALCTEARSLYALCDCFTASEGEAGYFVGGQDFSRYSGFITYFKAREDFSYNSHLKNVSMLGIKNNTGTFIAVPVGMRYDWQIHMSKQNDTYHLGLYYDLGKFEIYEDIVVDIFVLSDNTDHIDMAKRYRRYMLDEYGAVPLKERIKQQKELEYCVMSPEIRIRLGWKPAPPEILEQTPENEPEMFAACTFDRVKDIITSLKNEGIDNAEICLVGWNKSGHDGRWPTAFPVEQKLGGKQKLISLIDFAKECGFTIVCHSNHTDCYSISDEWGNGDIAAKEKDGSLKTTAAWSGGTMYDICPQKAYEHAKTLIPKLSDLGFRGLHYIDVISIVPPRTCHDKNHPVNSRQSVEYYNKTANLSKDYIGGFSSEGGLDFFMPVLDSCLYARFNRITESFFDKGFSLWEIVTHGTVLSSPATNAVNYTIKTPDDRLQIYQHANRPSFYYYSNFKKGAPWMGTDDFTANTQKDLSQSASLIAKGCKEYKKVSYLQYEFIENEREICQNVFETLFSDGSRIYTNYNQSKAKLPDGTIINGKDWLLKKCT